MATDDEGTPADPDGPADPTTRPVPRLAGAGADSDALAGDGPGPDMLAGDGDGLAHGDGPGPDMLAGDGGTGGDVPPPRSGGGRSLWRGSAAGEAGRIRDRLRWAAEERRRLVALRDGGTGPLREPIEQAVDLREDTDALVDADGGRMDVRAELRTPLSERPTVRVGAYAWAVIGVAIALGVIGVVVATLSSVIIPLVLALFPAAVLSPLVTRLKRRGAPPALAAAVVLVGTLGAVAGIGALIAPQVAAQLQTLSDSIQAGYQQLDDFLASGPFGLQPIQLNELVDNLSETLRGGAGEAAGSALGVAAAFFQGAASVLLALIVLFFYLKDGAQIGQWVKTLFPHRLHADVDTIGDLIWRTIGGYIQGQLLVAVVDAVFIGLGLWILGVPLALPLGVIVFFGGLFPVVGASISGFLAALVALATNGPATALLVVGVVIGVQALEGNLLQPLILGRALELHPLAIVCSLALGGFLLGILGAFLAVPVAAATSQTVGYIRNRVPG